MNWIKCNYKFLIGFVLLLMAFPLVMASAGLGIGDGYKDAIIGLKIGISMDIFILIIYLGVTLMIKNQK